MFKIIVKKWRNHTKPMTSTDITPEVVEIPVGGIDETTGAVYEQKVYPEGKEPIYKEVKMNETKKG